MERAAFYISPIVEWTNTPNSSGSLHCCLSACLRIWSAARSAAMYFISRLRPAWEFLRRARLGGNFWGWLEGLIDNYSRTYNRVSMEQSRELKLLIKAEELMNKGAKYGLIENGVTYKEIEEGEGNKYGLGDYISERARFNKEFDNASKQYDKDIRSIAYWTLLPQNTELKDFRDGEIKAMQDAERKAHTAAEEERVRQFPEIVSSHVARTTESNVKEPMPTPPSTAPRKWWWSRNKGGSRKNVIQAGKRHRSHPKNRTKKHKSRK
jgi:hypothetical protein